MLVKAKNYEFPYFKAFSIPHSFVFIIIINSYSAEKIFIDFRVAVIIKKSINICISINPDRL
jgi:hypothetical protein